MAASCRPSTGSGPDLIKGFTARPITPHSGRYYRWSFCRKKGRKSVDEKARESDPEFVHLRHQHSAVESAINALEQHGLDICLDHGVAGFKRYVALAVLARDIHRLGAVLMNQEA